jgi:hypothetical protein
MRASFIMHYPDKETPGRRDRSEAVSKSAMVETLPRNRIGKHKPTSHYQSGSMSDLAISHSSRLS